MSNSNNKKRNSKRKYQMISHIEQQNLERNGISKKLFYERVSRGGSREKAMTKSPRNRIFKTTEEKKLMKENGIDDKTFRSRIYRNMDRKEAATRPKRKYNFKHD
ncbi:hypothetical protein DD894_00355 [Staphylococcus pseudintermedius]|uniref:hypothetical protein n=1 Tax=Staphylococcus pseudintermedius TaxID=283734 RepID=UPI000D7297AB|nr:hypothetical protein [Staphylococcus pseudintermedius]PXA16514.1 hypothetical protein DD894_00355 [Staphylococcus pseudintermedius]